MMNHGYMPCPQPTHIDSHVAAGYCYTQGKTQSDPAQHIENQLISCRSNIAVSIYQQQTFACSSGHCINILLIIRRNQTEPNCDCFPFSIWRSITVMVCLGPFRRWRARWCHKLPSHALSETDKNSSLDIIKQYSATLTASEARKSLSECAVKITCL